MGRSTVRALLSARAVVLGSRSMGHGPRQGGAVTPGQVLCSEMQSALSLKDAIKSLVRSQVVFSDSANTVYFGTFP